MSNFVELENGSLINLDHVVKVHPKTGANRIDFVTGAHLQLTDTEMEEVRSLLIPNLKELEKQRFFDEALAVVGTKKSKAYSVGPNGEEPTNQPATEEKPKRKRGRPPKNKPAN